ncbi:hypothetical protein FH972_026591 [Carpinus fangiana]|uniref:UBL3-like ubiquitin domain-containing protein n=1 Tax=Carpinus fangiana TaxID=176857 RepID=A0A5N6L4F3_9ROSI|nr:hypothetical protein FH972_026591 [Carpinus fangiana]
MPVPIIVQTLSGGFDEIPYGWTVVNFVLRVGPWIVAVVLLKIWFGGARNRAERNMHSKVVIMTGGTSGIGAAVARDLAERGAQLVLLVQQELTDPFLVDYIMDLRTQTSNELIMAEHVDLGSLHSIRKFATKWIDNAPPRRLDMIVLCANTLTPSRGYVAGTGDGVEATYGINYLANFHLLSILSPAIRAQPPDRDVRILFGACSSYVTSPMLDDKVLSVPRVPPTPAVGKKITSAQSQLVAANPSAAYSASKLQLMTFAHALQKHLSDFKRPDKGPAVGKVLLVDPGWSRTPGTRRQLTRGSLLGLALYLAMWPFWWLVLKSPEQGAQSFLHAAMEAEYARVEGGLLIRDCQPAKLRRAEIKDEGVQKEIWQTSEKAVETLEKEGARARAAEKKAAEEAKKDEERQKEHREKKEGSRRTPPQVAKRLSPSGPPGLSTQSQGQNNHFPSLFAGVVHPLTVLARCLSLQEGTHLTSLHRNSIAMVASGEAPQQTPASQSASSPAQPTMSSVDSPKTDQSAPPASDPTVPSQQPPVEMQEIDGSAASASHPQAPERFTTATEGTSEAASTETSTTKLVAGDNAPFLQNRSRAESSAIGPSLETDAPPAMPDAVLPTVMITLCLPTTGTRHPFKIDERHLKRRNKVVASPPASPTLAQAVDGAANAVAAEGQAEPKEPLQPQSVDPWGISIYTVKELIWSDWRDEWELRPTSPSAIRLIHFGKVLDDKSILKDLKLNATSPNMVHMSVKPADLDDDETGGKLGKVASRTSNPRGRRGNNRPESNADETERSPGCRCLADICLFLPWTLRHWRPDECRSDAPFYEHFTRTPHVHWRLETTFLFCSFPTFVYAKHCMACGRLVFRLAGLRLAFGSGASPGVPITVAGRPAYGDNSVVCLNSTHPIEFSSR